MIGRVMAGVILLVAWLTWVTDWVDWPSAGQWLKSQTQWPQAGWSAVLGIGIALLLSAAIYRVRGSRRLGQPPIIRALSWWAVAAGAIAVAGITWGAITWLLDEAANAKDPAAARVEAVKIGLSIGAGTGGVFALLLAVRRQWHQELSTAATVLDSTEKRVAELYTKAVEQLGSEKAPVRLAALYALERVAQNNPDQRQTVVNVLCAYLRMPYTVPTISHDDGLDREEHRERVQEREVRLTAQRLLTEHVRILPSMSRPPDTYWKDLNFDLTGAVLIEFDMTFSKLKGVRFSNTHFYGETSLQRADIHALNLSDTSINEKISFAATRFYFADLSKVKFLGDTTFDGATFEGFPRFYDIDFIGNYSFDDVNFTHGVGLEDVRFAGNTPPELTGHPGLKDSPNSA